MLHRPVRELMRSITLQEFNGYMRLMFDRQADQDEDEDEDSTPRGGRAEKEIDLSEMNDEEVAAIFGARRVR